MEILYGSETNDYRYTEMYHYLAEQVHEGLGCMLDRVLLENGVLELSIRHKIVSSFLFRFMDRLDQASPVFLDENDCLFNSKTEYQATYLRDKWYPTLSFLRRNQNGEFPSEVLSILTCVDTWLHETSGAWEEAYFQNTDDGSR